MSSAMSRHSALEQDIELPGTVAASSLLVVVGSCLEQDKHLPSRIDLKVVHEVKQLLTGFGQVINTSPKSLVLINLVFSLADNFSMMEVEVPPFLGITFTVSTALSGISFWPSGFVTLLMGAADRARRANWRNGLESHWSG